MSLINNNCNKNDEILEMAEIFVEWLKDIFKPFPKIKPFDIKIFKRLI